MYMEEIWDGIAFPIKRDTRRNLKESWLRVDC